MATSYSGYEGNVKLGSSNTISLMGTWSMSGVTTDMLETTAFGDDWKQFRPGQRDGGTISFNGLFDGTDANGQTALRNYNAANTSVSDIRFYIDANSYYIPSTTNPLSYVWITEWNVDSDKSQLVTASFSCKVSGKMVLV